MSSTHCVRTNSYRSQLLKVTVGSRFKILTFSSDSQSTRAGRVLKGLKPHVHCVLQPEKCSPVSKVTDLPKVT